MPNLRTGIQAQLKQPNERGLEAPCCQWTLENKLLSGGGVPEVKYAGNERKSGESMDGVRDLQASAGKEHHGAEAGG